MVRHSGLQPGQHHHRRIAGLTFVELPKAATPRQRAQHYESAAVVEVEVLLVVDDVDDEVVVVEDVELVVVLAGGVPICMIT